MILKYVICLIMHMILKTQFFNIVPTICSNPHTRPVAQILASSSGAMVGIPLDYNRQLYLYLYMYLYLYLYLYLHLYLSFSTCEQSLCLSLFWPPANILLKSVFVIIMSVFNSSKWSKAVISHFMQISQLHCCSIFLSEKIIK